MSWETAVSHWLTPCKKQQLLENTGFVGLEYHAIAMVTREDPNDPAWALHIFTPLPLKELFLVFSKLDCFLKLGQEKSCTVFAFLPCLELLLGFATVLFTTAQHNNYDVFLPFSGWPHPWLCFMVNRLYCCPTWLNLRRLHRYAWGLLPALSGRKRKWNYQIW